MLKRVGSGASAKPVAVPASDSLDAFSSETASPAAPVSVAATPRVADVASTSVPGLTGSRVLVAVALVAFVAAVGFAAYLLKRPAFESAVPSDPTVTIESDPPGADVLSAGVSRGQTPLKLTLSPGTHALEVVHAGRRQVLSVVASAETAVVHTVHFGASSEPLRIEAKGPTRSSGPGRVAPQPSAPRTPARSLSASPSVAGKTAVSPAAAGPPVPGPTAPPEATTGPPAGARAASDATVPAEPIRETLPAWNPPDARAGRTEYSGVLRVHIGADGRVTLATILDPSHPKYDLEIVKAARGWVYKPALVAARPVASHRDITVRLVPR